MFKNLTDRLPDEQKHNLKNVTDDSMSIHHLFSWCCDLDHSIRGIKHAIDGIKLAQMKMRPKIEAIDGIQLAQMKMRAKIEATQGLMFPKPLKAMSCDLDLRSSIDGMRQRSRRCSG